MRLLTCLVFSVIELEMFPALLASFPIKLQYISSHLRHQHLMLKGHFNFLLCHRALYLNNTITIETLTEIL